MTPDSILKAMAEALAKKYTDAGRHESADARLDDRVDSGMMKTFVAEDGMLSLSAITPREAATEVMTVVGPVLELFFRLTETTRELAKSHKEFVDVWARHDADAHTLEIQYVAESLLGQIEVQEPADWNYVSRFSATPNEIHDLLSSGLHPNVLKAFIDEVKAGRFD